MNWHGCILLHYIGVHFIELHCIGVYATLQCIGWQSHCIGVYEEEQQSGCQLDGALRGEGGMAAICFFFYSEKHFDKKNWGREERFTICHFLFICWEIYLWSKGTAMKRLNSGEVFQTNILFFHSSYLTFIWRNIELKNLHRRWSNWRVSNAKQERLE